MRDPMNECLVKEADAASVRDIRLVPAGTEIDLGDAAFYLRETGFTGKAGDIALIPGALGVASALMVVACEAGIRHPLAFAALPARLPSGDWRLDLSEMPVEQRNGVAEDATLGFCLAAYRFTVSDAASRVWPRLVVNEGVADSLIMARAAWLGRDLINMPANHLGPVELAERAARALRDVGAQVEIIASDRLGQAYPCLAAVGAGSERPPRVVLARWEGTDDPSAPLISLAGKGVCFDTGGYDIKSSAGMLRMKKDMGGAAIMLAVALTVIERRLPVRLELRLGCVENSISGHAMRPGDILATRAGLTVEVGNTDAEGRLVLCDLLTEACEQDPDLLIDAATLTGAARVALGPDLPALFCNDDMTAEIFLKAGKTTTDMMWRLPLWHAYDAWLDRPTADLSNVSEKPMAGAVTAALFLQRFVKSSVIWAHFDVYGWNDTDAPGRPKGGETMALRAISEAIRMVIAP